MIIDIYIPTLGKRDITAMLATISKTSRKPHVVHITSEGKSYAQAINALFSRLCRLRQPTDYFFCGADDLIFYDDWDLEAVNVGGPVIGTNDLHHPNVLRGSHATHYLVQYGYCLDPGGTADKSYPVLYDYVHNFTDTEFIETAKKRGVFRMASASKVEHIHPAFGLAPVDEGYEKSRSTHDTDLVTFNRRRPFWDQIGANRYPHV